VVPTTVALVLVRSTTELLRRDTTMIEGQSMTTVADVVAQVREGRLEDFVREAVVRVARELMEGEISAEVGAELGEVALSSGRRIGTRIGPGRGRRGWGDRAAGPGKRSGPACFPSFWEARRPAEQAIVAVVIEAYVNGVSTRKVDRLLEQLGISGMTKDRVSALCRGLDERVTAFRERPLEGAYPYLWLDAKYVKVRATTGGSCPRRLVVAYAVHETGVREVIGLDVGEVESGSFWVEFLHILKRRGLSGFRVAITDQHEGLKAAVARVLGCPWQRCSVHFTRDMVMHCRRDQRGLVAAAFREIFQADGVEQARQRVTSVLERLAPVAPKVSRQRSDPRFLGGTTSSYYGGRAERRIRRSPVPVVYCDFLSTYPTVCALMGIWRHLASRHIAIVDSNDDIRELLNDLTVEDCLDRTLWPRLVGIARVIPNGDVLPVRARYGAGPSYQIGLNPLHSEDPFWYTLADLAASKILTGRTPQIERAAPAVSSSELAGLTSVRPSRRGSHRPGASRLLQSDRRATQSGPSSRREPAREEPEGARELHLPRDLRADDPPRTRWRPHGARHRVRTRGRSIHVSGSQPRRTYRDTILDYATHIEPKSLAADGKPCDRTTIGLLGRRPVTPTIIRWSAASTSISSASRVNSSTTLSSRIGRPSAV
jgi:putative transposase